MCRVLDEEFKDSIGVAMFRVTAVDSGKSESYRSKLVHVIYSGPELMVMKRARVSGWTWALKQPFNFNISIQTSDVPADLTQEDVIVRLRKSGGAHQPIEFDFSNDLDKRAKALAQSVAQPAAEQAAEQPEDQEQQEEQAIASASLQNRPTPLIMSEFPPSVVSAAVTPGGSHSLNMLWEDHAEAFHHKDSERLKLDYFEDEASRLIVTDGQTGEVKVSLGQDEIGYTFDEFFEEYPGPYQVVKIDKVQLASSDFNSSDGVVYFYWTSEKRKVLGVETICIQSGKIVLHTMTVLRKSTGEHVDDTGDYELVEEDD